MGYTEFQMTKNQTDYTYHRFNNKIIENGTAIQSVFNGSIFNRSKFISTSMMKCDFESLDAQEVEFISCDFSRSDLKSCNFNKTLFKNCLFNIDLIKNCIFYECDFESCSFCDATCLNTTFEKCAFTSCELSDSSFSLCRIVNTKFYNMKFADCSFYRHYLKDTRFDSCSMNIDDLGQLFTLNYDDIFNMNYIFLSEEYGKMSNTVFMDLNDVFIDKKWDFFNCVLKVNQNRMNTFDFLYETSLLWAKQLDNNELVNKEDIEFITLIIENLYEDHKLPLFALYLFNDTISESIIKNENSHFYPDTIKKLKGLIYDIQVIINGMTTYFDSNSMIPLSRLDESIKLEIRYNSEERNILNFADLMNYMCKSLDIQTTDSVLINTRKGSIIEILFTTMISVFCLQFLLYGLNGVIIQIINLKASTKVLTNESIPKFYLDQVKNGKSVKPSLNNFGQISSILMNKNFKEVLFTIKKQIDKVDVDTFNKVDEE